MEGASPICVWIDAVRLAHVNGLASDRLAAAAWRVGVLSVRDRADVSGRVRVGADMVGGVEQPAARLTRAWTRRFPNHRLSIRVSACVVRIADAELWEGIQRAESGPVQTRRPGINSASSGTVGSWYRASSSLCRALWRSRPCFPGSFSVPPRYAFARYPSAVWPSRVFHRSGR